MSRDDYPKPGLRGIDVEILHRVQHKEASVFYFEHACIWYVRGPGTRVVVTSYRGHRRNLSQTLDHRVIADITGVDDEITSNERLQTFWAKKSVRIGYQSYSRHLTPTTKMRTNP